MAEPVRARKMLLGGVNGLTQRFVSLLSTVICDFRPAHRSFSVGGGSPPDLSAEAQRAKAEGREGGERSEGVSTTAALP